MIYPVDFEIKLGFNQIREKLAGWCLSALGKQEVGQIVFTVDFQVIQIFHEQTWELKKIKENAEPFPFAAFDDTTEHLKTVSIEGSFIEAEIFIQISNSLKIAFGCVDFLKKFAEGYPHLYRLSEKASAHRSIIKEIDSKIDDRGVIKDNASPALRAIRGKLKNEIHRARKLIDQLFREAVANSLVPDGSLPVVRQGRVVIPVLAEHKRKMSGVIMDESATGQTVYIEPTEVLEANNDIRNLEMEERRECVKILKDLSSLLRNDLAGLRSTFWFLGQIDLIQAKAKFATELNCMRPNFVDGPVLKWQDASHPLLLLSHKEKPVVPLSIQLTRENRFLLVSGPNAGGKSVCLKTVGLLQYMWQCGLPIPLDETSEVGLFKDIFLDIGDQQSIENDLSTYSSHLRNMRTFVERASSESLVLMDELGAGTDPNFGGGIAEAILHCLLSKNAWGVATTHYYNLKLFAEQRSDIRNAAMAFDSKKLEPLFKLEIGKPGSSFALEIARKIGLPKSIIDEAENNIGKDLAGLENLMKRVSDESLQLAKREDKLRQKEIQYNNLLNRYTQLSNELQSRQKLIIDKAKEEAALLLKQTNKEIEKTIRHIKESKAEKKETRKVREGLENLKKRVVSAVPKPEPATNEPIKEGDYVRIDGQEVVGKVISILDKSAVVQFGDMRSSVKLNKLIKSSHRESKSFSVARPGGLDYISKQSSFSTTLDVRGKRVEEVHGLLDQFLDDAILLGQSQLKILHGKGEGVLRKVIRDHLKRNNHVVSFGDEHVERGGDGITQVILK